MVVQNVKVCLFFVFGQSIIFAVQIVSFCCYDVYSTNDDDKDSKICILGIFQFRYKQN